MHKEKLAPRTATAIINSHLIRTARMLTQMARVLGADQDVAVYEEDIALWGEALQKHSWDADAGYFSYVLHDRPGPGHAAFCATRAASNFNLGQDGVMPLLAGICTPAQEQTLLAHLQSPQRLWTPIGLSTVDQSAPYYRHDGYWNGAVWMPHQWFLWKTMLDLGQPDFAYKIAHTALDLWKAEVDESYDCFEHFLIESGRGAGWHQFSALSSPVLAWFAAYYSSGPAHRRLRHLDPSLRLRARQLRRDRRPRTAAPVRRRSHRAGDARTRARLPRALERPARLHASGPVRHAAGRPPAR